jgi:hypothetical protein
MKKTSVRNRRSCIKTHVVLVLTVTAFFCTDAFYPYRKRDWRAQRASPLLACDGI